MNVLPSSWVRVHLSDIGLFHPPSVTPSRWPDMKWELWSVPSFPSGQPERLLGREIGSNKQLVAPSDVLLCKINPRINRVWRVAPGRDLDQIASTEWIVIRSPACDPDYLVYLLREPGFRARLCADVSGVGGSLTRARPKIVSTIDVSLAPREEQTRIADKITVLDTHSRAARKHLDAIPPLLEQFRASVLSAAFSGRLTADWREKQKRKGVKIETAEHVVRRLTAAHDAAGGHKRGNAAEPTEDAHDLALSDVASGWTITEMRNVVEPDRPITYGILKPGPDVKGGVPYVRVADFPNDAVNLESIRRTSTEIDAAYARARLREGDVLLSIRGTVGRVCTVPPELAMGNITQDTARLSVQRYMDARFVTWFLRAPETQDRMARAVKGVAVRGINIGDVRALQVPVPPLKEQKEISARIEDLMTRFVAATMRHEAGLDLLSGLGQSILAKAFRGELVPQNPDEEPAAELLKRMAEEKEKMKAAKKATPRKGRGSKPRMSPSLPEVAQ